MRNLEIAEALNDLADLSDYAGDNPFKARAYRMAALTLKQLDTPIEQVAEQGIDALKSLPGVGTEIAEKIQQYLQTGTIKRLEELKAEVPAGILPLLRLPGLGPKTAKVLYLELGIDSVESLQDALESGAVLKLPGFGERRQKQILQSMREVRE
jgi:DNA polymerase (family 10)